MAENIIEIKTVLELASESAGNLYQVIKGKRIMFETTSDDGKRMILCTPSSKYHKTIDAGWVDITMVQYQLIESYDVGIIIFRLEGQKLTIIKWDDLKPLLTKDCMRYTVNSKHHWKLNIHRKYIKVSGNDKVLEANSSVYVG